MEDRGNNNHWAVVDVEVSLSDHKIHDIGALRDDGAVYHGCIKEELMLFLHDVTYVCGHNIINHDAKYLFEDGNCRFILVDTASQRMECDSFLFHVLILSSPAPTFSE